MNIDDEVLLRAFRNSVDPDREPDREEELTDNESDIEPEMPTFADKDMEKIQKDSQLRQHLKIGKNFTGPKGVKEDYKFHQQQEHARLINKQTTEYAAISGKMMSNDWIQSTIEEEDENKFDTDFLKNYRKKRILELQGIHKNEPITSSTSTNKREFGLCLELTNLNFVSQIEKESTNVLILFYDISVIESRIMIEYFTKFAALYRQTKFCVVQARETDPDYDLIAVPAIYVYKHGDFLNCFLRIQDEIPGWNENVRVSFKDVEDYLLIQNVLVGPRYNDYDEDSTEDEDEF